MVVGTLKISLKKEFSRVLQCQYIAVSSAYCLLVKALVSRSSRKATVANTAFVE